MGKRRGQISLLLVILLLGTLGVPDGGAVEDFGNEVRGYYVAGGVFFGGASIACLAQDTPGVVPDNVAFDVGGACDLRCPGGTCDITVKDDVTEHVWFRVCFDGETFCRAGVYVDHVSLPGSRVTVVVATEHGTHGVIIVR